MKTISFAIPCYNSAEYMAKCIESILPAGDDIEILIVDDGSSDDTLEVAKAFEKRFPNIVKAIHKENGGHGSAVNTGLANAGGLYFKVVDSDDWLDKQALSTVMDYLRTQVTSDDPTDMVVANYVYEKVHEHKQKEINYTSAFPVEERFTWEDMGTFHKSQYLLMHSVIYRTQLLKDMGLKLPEHCFYVDNIFVYAPLPHVKSIYYINVDLYRYFIGREDQSVNQEVMMSRIDQQLKVTREMIDLVDVMSVEPRRLRKYMESYLSMMLAICSVFLRMRNTDEDEKKLKDIWNYLKKSDPALYRRVRSNVLNVGTNLPTKLGRKVGLDGYKIAQKLFKFN